MTSRRVSDLDLALTSAALGDGSAAVLLGRQEPGPGTAAAGGPRPARLEADERAWRARLHGSAREAAELVLRAHLADAPTDAAALCVLGRLVLDDGRPQEAGLILQRALQLAPGYARARQVHAAALFQQNRDFEAMAEIGALLAQDPTHPGYRTLLGSCLARTGDVEQAITVFGALAQDAPDQVDVWLSYAQALAAGGRRAESAQAFRRCLALAPAHGEAHWGLLELTSGPAAAPDVAALRGHLATAGLPAMTRCQLHYTLGNALERAGAYEESFRQISAGAALRRGLVRWRPDLLSSRARRTAQVLDPAFFAARAGWGDPDGAPIFVLGMPRAGSTLIEQILASHGAVEGTQELPEIGHLEAEITQRSGAGARYPECLASLDAGEAAALGARYLARCRGYRRTGRPMFIDKMPGNWLSVGLIHLILPNARIIDARRDPMANCFAAFKRYFGTGQDFTYDLTDLGRYYRDYLALMGHFDAVLPGRVHRVTYEAMVGDTEAEIRRLLAYCGLPFEPACLRFWETARGVGTASAQQVRRPIYREALDHWRHFEPWLGPLRAALGGTAAP